MSPVLTRILELKRQGKTITETYHIVRAEDYKTKNGTHYKRGTVGNYYITETTNASGIKKKQTSGITSKYSAADKFTRDEIMVRVFEKKDWTVDKRFSVLEDLKELLTA